MHPTDVYEVDSVIAARKVHSAAGIDGVSTAAVKSIKDTIVAPLTHIINLSISSGTFPHDWKLALVTPIHKSGNKKCPENYRPISLLGVFSKVLEKIVNKQLIRYLESNELLSAEQFGFRQGKSTEDAVLKLFNSVCENLDKGRRVVGVFLDLAKAFDSVSIPILLKKLEHLGIRGLPLEWFKSYLTERRQCLKVNDHISEQLSINFGVPQGSVLGPTLFIAYINDIFRKTPSDAITICYADDTAILFHADSWVAAHEKAEQGMSLIKSWLNCNLLTMNATKSKFISFHKTRASRLESSASIKIHSACNAFQCSCATIERVCSIKYLGVTIDENLTFEAHINSTAQRVRKLMHVMRSLRRCADSQVIQLVYTALVESILGYCISAWGGAAVSYMLVLERAQRAVLKVRYGRPFRHPTDALFQDAGVLNVRQLYISRIVLHIHRSVLNCDQYPTLLKQRLFKIDSVHVKTRFAQRFFEFMSVFVYNKIAKTCEIKNRTVRQVKLLVIKYLLSLSYSQTQNLIKTII